MTQPWAWEEGHAFESLFKKPCEGEFYSINRSTIGGKIVFVCGEIDAVDENNRLLELKMKDPLDVRSLQDGAKLHQTWFQTFISGVQVLKYGSFNQKGNVCGVKEINTSDMLQKDTDKQNTELHFCVLDSVLSMLAETVEAGKMHYLYLPEKSDKVFLYKQTEAKYMCQGAPPKEFGSWYFEL